MADKEGSRFTDNRRMEGTVLEIIDGVIKFLQGNLKIKTNIYPRTDRRVDKYVYPLVALREAILNGLIHRDYSIHPEAIPIEIFIYKDCLEIRSPGGLYGRLTLDKPGTIQPNMRSSVQRIENLGDHGESVLRHTHNPKRAAGR